MLMCIKMRFFLGLLAILYGMYNKFLRTLFHKDDKILKKRKKSGKNSHFGV